jgi:hypothetical protein
LRLKSFATLAAVFAAVAVQPAAADDIWAGALVHDVDTPFNLSGQENGVDVELGWRGDAIGALSLIGGPAPYAFVSVNTAGNTDFAALGLGWKFGSRLYVRPGIGVAVHDANHNPAPGVERIDFGSRVLFEPELSAGIQVSDRLSVEASWVHFSHAQLFGHNNPGTDSFGVRLALRLP